MKESAPSHPPNLLTCTLYQKKKKKSAEKCVTDARQAWDEFRLTRMPIALNLAILRQKMLLGAANSFSSANATIKTKQNILWRILQFAVVTQSKPPITVQETPACIPAAEDAGFQSGVNKNNTVNIQFQKSCRTCSKRRRFELGEVVKGCFALQSLAVAPLKCDAIGFQQRFLSAGLQTEISCYCVYTTREQIKQHI